VKEKPLEVSSSDDRLVVQARAGDMEAMDELVARHHATVFRVAMGILRDEDAASDAAQEAFLKAFRGLEGFRGEATFKTWLLTITANEARMALRKIARRGEVALDATPPVPSRDPSAQEHMEGQEEMERIVELLGQLPEKQRQAVELRIFEGLSFREIGAIIDSSEGAARVNYHHGIRRLREKVG
jgi:RNA polymerase sigma-70 factor (ECF subfamily)